MLASFQLLDGELFVELIRRKSYLFILSVNNRGPLGVTKLDCTYDHVTTSSLFQGFVSFLLPCFAVDHLYLSYDEYLFSEEETPLTEGEHS